MKREGKQHGMVRSSVLLPVELDVRPNAKVINCLKSPPIAGVHAKVPLKPNNHSKYTGKCRKARCKECHACPTSKSRDKTKGSYKLRSSDVTLNHRLVSCRVVEGGSLLSFKGISATEILGDLSASVCSEENEQYDDSKKEDNLDSLECGCYVPYLEPIDNLAMNVNVIDDKEDDEVAPAVLTDSEKDSNEDDEMEFYVVGMACENSDAEDWLVVENM